LEQQIGSRSGYTTFFSVQRRVASARPKHKNTEAKTTKNKHSRSGYTTTFSLSLACVSPSPRKSDVRHQSSRGLEGKGEACATRIDVRCSDRKSHCGEAHLIATGGSATAEMAMKYSSFSLWLSRAWPADMDESQQYGNYHEIAALAAIQQPALIVFCGGPQANTWGPVQRKSCGSK